MGTSLIAMVTVGRGISEYKKVLTSDADIFRMPDNLASSTDYNPGASLEDCEWFELSDFSNESYCLPLLRQEAFSTVDYNAISPDDFGKIIFMCGYQDDYFFFQRVTPARQIKQKRIYFGELCKYEEDSASISLNEFADAIYSTTENKLYFRKLRDISAIFDGIDVLYREATEVEVRNFLGYSFIEMGEGFTPDNVKTNNRKRIALALETLGRFSDEDKHTVFDYIRDYCPDLTCTNNRFNIHNEDSLKKLLYGIEQRYYTTLIGEERRLANSVISLSQGGRH